MTRRAGFVFAGGGTGGHLYPGLAIREQIVELVGSDGTEFDAIFACSGRDLDREILTHEGVEFVPIPAKPFSLRPRAFASWASSWGGAVRESRALIRRLGDRGDRVTVVALGGFVAAPVVQAARAERVRTVMVNLDAVPGKANRWIARRASRVLTAAEVAGTAWEVVPPIVRRAALPPGDAAHCRHLLGLDPQRPVLLVTGASQGAATINDFIAGFVRRHGALLRDGGWQVVHQTGGKGDMGGLASAYESAGIAAVVRPYFREMGVAWGAAELAVSRAGAGSVAEAWASRVPAVFLPYPYHRDEHQRVNARPLERCGAALVVKDQIDPGANLESIGPVLAGLISSPPRRAIMRETYQSLGAADGARRVAMALMEPGSV